MGPEEHRETEKKEPGEGQGPRFSQPLPAPGRRWWGGSGGFSDPRADLRCSFVSSHHYLKAYPAKPFLVFIHTDSHQNLGSDSILISQLGMGSEQLTKRRNLDPGLPA